MNKENIELGFTGDFEEVCQALAEGEHNLGTEATKAGYMLAYGWPGSYGEVHHDDAGPIATPTDACREYTYAVGAERPEQPWILTNYDTWERNPYYRHTAGRPYPPRPDCDEWELDAWESDQWCPERPPVAQIIRPVRVVDDADIPF
jgi:hypothetical protein